MRSTTESDLMDPYGLRRACQWSGNSPKTAMENYALVRNMDFEDLGAAGKFDAKCAAILPDDAKSAAESASTAAQKPNKKRTAETVKALTCVQVGAEGLEPPTPSV